MTRYKYLRIRPIVYSLFLLLLVSCKDDADPSPSTPENEGNQYVNEWIEENMNFWYYWNTDLPSSPDRNQDPDDFFNSLLSSEDRFSWIQENYEELVNSLNGVTKEAGFEFVLYRESSSNDNVIAQILYVKPSSPADAASLKRGDVITHINGTQITISNYQTLLSAMGNDYSIQYKPYSVEEQTFGTEQSVSLSTVEYEENPNYLHKVIAEGDHKIGYYVYNFFASGADEESTQYDDEMDNIFNEFKSAGVTDMVLDLRYNSGGSEISSNNLSSLLGTGVDNSKVFLKKEYNDEVENEILNDPDLGEAFLTTHFKTKDANIGSLLQGARVYVLTSSRTASASELVINALKPYMDVFIIGDTTYGKNVGSISLYKENDARNTWGMQPIVVKVFNSLDQSDYSKGFFPDVVDADNSALLYPLGDPRETLLSQAIAQITGQSSLGRKANARDRKQSLGHSLDTKRRSYNLTVDKAGMEKLFLK